jgi:Xaa-Pro aminopeptidase
MHPMTAIPTGSRLAALRELLREKGLDGLLISGSDNRRYLSGFSAREEILHESCGSLLVTAEAAMLFTDFRYLEWAENEVTAFDVLMYQAGLGVLLAEQLQVFGVGRLGYEAAYLTCGQHQRLVEAAAAAGLQVEWAAHRGAGGRSPGGQNRRRNRRHAPGPGPHRTGVHRGGGPAAPRHCRSVRWAGRSNGASGKPAPPWPLLPSWLQGRTAPGPIIAPEITKFRPGSPSSSTWGPGWRAIAPTSPAPSSWGSPASASGKSIASSDRAQARAEAGLRAGLETVQGDALARDLIAQAGYGEAFGHSLGHGVGLAVHEAPGLSPLKERNATLRAGSIVTVEPGIYLSGWGGVRLEDMALIREDRAEVLNNLGFYEF